MAEQHTEFSLLQLHIAEALHLAAAGGTGFLTHHMLLSAKNALCSCEQRANDRGTTSGLPVPCGSGLTERRHAPAR